LDKHRFPVRKALEIKIIFGTVKEQMKDLSSPILTQMEKSCKLEKSSFHRLTFFDGQAYAEYLIILAVLLGLGAGVASIFTGTDALQDIFYDYYASVANYLNLPFF
jgi:hypothetical protein